MEDDLRGTKYVWDFEESRDRVLLEVADAPLFVGEAPEDIFEGVDL
jgi:hypothetical protein